MRSNSVGCFADGSRVGAPETPCGRAQSCVAARTHSINIRRHKQLRASLEVAREMRMHAVKNKLYEKKENADRLTKPPPSIARNSILSLKKASLCTNTPVTSCHQSNQPLPSSPNRSIKVLQPTDHMAAAGANACPPARPNNRPPFGAHIARNAAIREPCAEGACSTAHVVVFGLWLLHVPSVH